MRKHLGIAITTYNRREIVTSLVSALRTLTHSDTEIVVSDDGSSDGTVEALRDLGALTIAGTNLGIARNKNRGLYYLMSYTDCDPILLLDDDVLPTIFGWDLEWIEACHRHGHVNHLCQAERHVIWGKCTAADPGITPVIGGVCLAFSRRVLAEIGYMDPRFGRYGHEHTDFSQRAIRLGYGGFVAGTRYYLVIRGGLEIVPVSTTGDRESLDHNTAIYEKLGEEPAFRLPWRNEEEYCHFLAEVSTVVTPRPQRHKVADMLASFDQEAYLAANPDVRAAGIDPHRHYLHFGMYEGRPLRPETVKTV